MKHKRTSDRKWKKMFVEVLEDRRLLAVIQWDPKTPAGNWNAPAEWIGGQVPTAADTAKFKTTGSAPKLTQNQDVAQIIVDTQTTLDLNGQILNALLAPLGEGTVDVRAVGEGGQVGQSVLELESSQPQGTLVANGVPEGAEIRIVPNTTLDFDIQEALTVTAWDGTFGEAGTRENASIRGGNTAFREATVRIVSGCAEKLRRLSNCACQFQLCA